MHVCMRASNKKDVFFFIHEKVTKDAFELKQNSQSYIYHISKRQVETLTWKLSNTKFCLVLFD